MACCLKGRLRSVCCHTDQAPTAAGSSRRHTTPATFPSLPASCLPSLFLPSRPPRPLARARRGPHCRPEATTCSPAYRAAPDLSTSSTRPFRVRYYYQYQSNCRLCSAVQCRSVPTLAQHQCSAVQCRAMQCRAVPCSSLPTLPSTNAAQCSTKTVPVQCSTGQCPPCPAPPCPALPPPCPPPRCQRCRPRARTGGSASTTCSPHTCRGAGERRHVHCMLRRRLGLSSHCSEPSRRAPLCPFAAAKRAPGCWRSEPRAIDAASCSWRRLNNYRRPKSLRSPQYGHLRTEGARACDTFGPGNIPAPVAAPSCPRLHLATSSPLMLLPCPAPDAPA